MSKYIYTNLIDIFGHADRSASTCRLKLAIIHPLKFTVKELINIFKTAFKLEENYDCDANIIRNEDQNDRFLLKHHTDFIMRNLFRTFLLSGLYNDIIADSKFRNMIEKKKELAKKIINMKHNIRVYVSNYSSSQIQKRIFEETSEILDILDDLRSSESLA